MYRVEDKIYNNGETRTAWMCKCDCGNKKVVISKTLVNNCSKSCGCLHKEIVSEFNYKTKNKLNSYGLSGNYGVEYTDKEKEFYFDLEDYDKIKPFCWYINKGYVISWKIGRMHRLIMNVNDDGIIVDHINGKCFDNRKENLRIGTQQDNTMNRNLNKNNTSKVKGVSWHTSQYKWQASISREGKCIYLGSYENFEDAVKARREAEEKYFGEWSIYNSRPEYKEEI